MRYLWMPRLAERIQAASTTTTNTEDSSLLTTSTKTYPVNPNQMDNIGTSQMVMANNNYPCYENNQTNPIYAHDNSSTTAVSPMSDLTDCYYPIGYSQNQDFFQANNPISDGFDGPLISPSGYFNREMGFEVTVEENNQWSGNNGGYSLDSLWNADDFLFFEQQFNIM